MLYCFCWGYLLLSFQFRSIYLYSLQCLANCICQYEFCLLLLLPVLSFLYFMPVLYVLSILFVRFIRSVLYVLSGACSVPSEVDWRWWSRWLPVSLSIACLAGHSRNHHSVLGVKVWRWGWAGETAGDNSGTGATSASVQAVSCLLFLICCDASGNFRIVLN